MAGIYTNLKSQSPLSHEWVTLVEPSTEAPLVTAMVVHAIAKVIDIGAYEFPESETAIEKESQQSFKLFPNPNNGTFSLSTNTSFDKNAKITIFNTLGQILLEMNPVLFHNNRLEFDLSNFLNGIYFLKLESNNKIIFEKFIIK